MASEFASEQTNNNPTPALKSIPASDTIGEQIVVTCAKCGEDVIMLSKTIKTYCYRCGDPVNHLDSIGLYYELSEAGSVEPE